MAFVTPTDLCYCSLAQSARSVAAVVATLRSVARDLLRRLLPSGEIVVALRTSASVIQPWEPTADHCWCSPRDKMGFAALGQVGPARSCAAACKPVGGWRLLLESSVGLLINPEP